MRQWFRFGLTQRFLLFFVLSGIFPVLLMGFFLIRDVHFRLEKRLTSLLQTGEQLALSIIQNDLERLTLIAQQSIVLSLREQYIDFIRTGRKDSLETIIQHLVKDKHLEFIILLDKDNRIVSSRGIAPNHYPDIQKNFDSYLKQRIAHFGTEEFSTSDQNPNRLYYVASAPIVFDNGQKGGTLVVGQYISTHFSFQELNQILPLLNIRITQPSKEKLIFHNKRLEKVESLKSFSIPLLNIDRRPIGSVVVSTPIMNEQKLYEHELLVSILYLLTGTALLTWLGLWLNQSIIHPLQALTDASVEVAKGNFGVRVSDRNTSREVRQTLHNFNKMTQQLGENDSIRNTFIASLTHDLRTPLLAERRVLELFMDFRDELPGNFVQLAQGLVHSNQHLIEMVSQMLEAYRLEAGKANLAYTPVVLHELLRECVDKLAPLAEMQAIEIRQEISSDFPALFADRRLLSRVLINLIGNAIDNLDKGNTVTVSAFEQGDRILLHVQDNGPGIPEESIPNLFERYTTGQVSRQKIASGLGLFICKIIMESHGGAISVDSKINEGTTFTLTFPKTPDTGG